MSASLKALISEKSSADPLLMIPFCVCFTGVRGGVESFKLLHVLQNPDLAKKRVAVIWLRV